VSCEKISAVIWTRDILDSAELAGYQLVFELHGNEIEIRPNSLVSQWEDLEVLIGKGKVIVREPGEEEELNTAFRQIWTEEKKKNPRLGASVRWAVQATPKGNLKLLLQGLPGDSQFLRSEPHLSADDTEAVHLDAFETDVDWKEAAPGRGPVPVLFARDPAAVAASLSRHPERIYAGTVSVCLNVNQEIN
jgi:hypothetical protein